MAYTVQEFLEKKVRERGDDGCSQCGCSRVRSLGERYALSGGPVCGDCFFESLSDLVEVHPIYRPGVPRLY